MIFGMMKRYTDRTEFSEAVAGLKKREGAVPACRRRSHPTFLL